MFTAKRRGFIALLAALLMAALIAFGISMLPAASRTASAETKSVSTAQALLTAFTEANEGDTIQLEGNIVIDMTDPGTVQQTGGHMVIASKAALLELYKGEGMTEEKAEQDSVADNITLDLNQKTLTLKTTSTVGCIAVYGVNLTVKNGTITGESEAGLAVVGNAGGDYGALTVEDTTINFKNLNTQAQSAAPVISGEGELTLSNVEYKLSAAEGAQEPVAPYVAEIGGKGYSSLQDAFDNATSGQTVVLSANITVDKYITVNYDDERKIGSGKDDNLNITFDLNGHVITLAESFTTQFSMDGRSSNKLAGGAFLRIYGADFTIIDNNATAKSSAWEYVGGGIDGRKITAIDKKEVSDNDGNEVTLIVAQDGANVTIEGGTYVIKDNTAACVYAFGNSTVNLVSGGTEDIAASHITIEGGEFINLSNAEYGYGTGSALVVNQANVAEQLVTIQGGTFYGRNPALGDDSKAAGTFITSGVKLYEDSKGNYIATEGDVPEGAVNTFYFEDGQVVSELNSAEAIKTAIEDGADYIRLGSNITGSIEIPSGKEITIDLNGKTLTNTEGEHTITNYGTLTVSGTGTVDNISDGRAALFNAYSGTMTVLGGTYRRSAENSTKVNGAGQDNGNSYYVILNQGNMTLGSATEDCNIVVYSGDSEEGSVNEHWVSALVSTGWYSPGQKPAGADNALLTIYDGTYYGGNIVVKGDELSSLNINGGTFNAGGQAVQTWVDTTINGGTFNGEVAAWAYGYNKMADVRADLDITDGTFNGILSANFLELTPGAPETQYPDENDQVSVSGGRFATDVTEYLEEGLMQSADGIIIEANAGAAQIGEDIYSTLQAAIDAAIDGATITLLADSVSGNRLEISGKTVTIVLNGHNITRENAAGTAIKVGNNAALTVIGEGKIDAGDYGPFTVQTSAQGTGRLTVKGGTYSQRIPAEWLAEGCALVNTTSGDFEVTEGDVVATIASGANTYAFTTLRAAVIAAEDGETVKLNKDITIGMTTSINSEYIGDKALTIDLNGKTISSSYYNGYVISGYYNRTVGSGKDTQYIDVRLTRDLTITSSNGLGRIVLNGGGGIYITAAENADINVNISNIIISGTIKSSNSPIRIDGSQQNASVFAEIDNVTVNVVNSSNSAVKAFVADSATVVMNDCNVSISNAPTVTQTQNAVAAEFTNSNVTIADSTFVSKSGAAIVFVGNLSDEAATSGNFFAYKTLSITNSIINGYTFGLSGNASEGNHGTIFNIENSTIAGTIGAGIFHPQVGILNILGNGNVISGTSGIEMRGGSLNIEGGVFTATSTALDISANPGSGSTIDGAAIVVSQHGYNPAIQVSIAGGVFNGLYALYEDDLVNEEGTEDIQISVSGGMYNGEVYSQNKSGFVTGGTFAALDGEYIAPGYAFDEATGTVVSATLNNNALADVRAYLASYGLLYGDIEDLATAGTPDALAQAIVNAYEAIAAATGEEAIAVAKMDALDAIDAFIDNLNTVKAEAIAELEELIMEPVDVTEDGEVIKEAVVAMPTYIVSAINGAKSVAEVEKYVEVATAEINELIDMREQAADDQLALENQLNSIISALGIVQQAGGSWSSSFLAGIEESVNTAKDNIFTISSLLGRPTDEATAESIFGKLEEANANIQGVYDKLFAEISAMLTGEGGISSQLEELKGLVDENSALAADIDNVLATAGRIEGALGSINSDNTLSDVLNNMNNLLLQYQSAVADAIADINGKFSELQSNILAALPTDSTIANALRSVIAGVENDLDILKAEVDALDEPNGALVTAINEKIEAAFESFGNTFTSELDKLNGAIAGLDTAIDNLPETLDIEGIKQAIADAKSAAEAAGAKVDALTGEEGVLTTIDGKIDAIDGVVDGIADAQESMGNALTTFATATDTALKGIQSDIDGLESKLNAMANTAATDKADILAKIAELKSAADDISEAIASLDGDSAEDLSGIAEDLAALQTALDGVKADIGNVSQQVGGVAEDNTNSMSNFAGLYLFLSALVVLAIAILIVVSVKKRR